MQYCSYNCQGSFICVEKYEDSVSNLSPSPSFLTPSSDPQLLTPSLSPTFSLAPDQLISPYIGPSYSPALSPSFYLTSNLPPITPDQLITPSPGFSITPDQLITSSPGFYLTPDQLITPSPSYSLTPNQLITPSPSYSITPDQLITPSPSFSLTPNQLITPSPGFSLTPNQLITPSPSFSLTPNQLIAPSLSYSLTPNQLITPSPSFSITPDQLITPSPSYSLTPNQLMPPSPSFSLTPNQLMPPAPSPSFSLTPHQLIAPSPSYSLTPNQLIAPSPSYSLTPNQLMPPAPSPSFSLTPSKLMAPAQSRNMNTTGICGNLDKNKGLQYCNDGYFCINDTCNTGDYRDDIIVPFGDKSCQYSGSGINKSTCQFSSLSDQKCGIQNNFSRCKGGMFCNDAGNCVYNQPLSQTTNNCQLFSGVGIRNCNRRVTADNTCGPKYNYRICNDGQFCTANGTCTKDVKQVSNKPDLCMKYSGRNIVNCALASAPGTAALARTPGPALAPGTSASARTPGPALAPGTAASARTPGPALAQGTAASTRTPGPVIKGISTNGTCGTNSMQCQDFQFCNDTGKCVSSKSKSDTYVKHCANYSGKYVTNCELIAPYTKFAVYPNTNWSPAVIPKTNVSKSTKAKLEDCANLCSNSSACTSFTYNSQKNCSIFNKTNFNNPSNLVNNYKTTEKNTYMGYKL